MTRRTKLKANSGQVPRSQYAKVKDVIERFTGHPAKPIGRIKAPVAPKTAAVLGYCDAIDYTTRRDGRVERYRHKFAESDRPLLCVGPDMKIFFLQGRYRFTELGIVDNSDKKHANAR